MKTIIPFLVVTFLISSAGNSIGQTKATTDSVAFCGKYLIAPKDCEKAGNMFKCEDYVFSWTYEPVEDLPRHKKELLSQIKKPRQTDLLIMGEPVKGYLYKTDKFHGLLVISEVNQRGVIINLWKSNSIRATKDLPEFIQKFISIKE